MAVAVKAQVHAGGRGKGVAIGPGDDRTLALEIASGRKPRPIRWPRAFSSSSGRQDAQQAAASLLGKTLVTYQTGSARSGPSPKSWSRSGMRSPANSTWAWPWTAALQCPVLMASTEGGVEIETVALETPEKIHRQPIDVGIGLADFQARKVSKGAGLEGRFGQEGHDVLQELRPALPRYGCLPRRDQSRCGDAQGRCPRPGRKMTFDDNALFRHPDIEKFLDEAEENPAELRAGRAV